MTVNEAYELLIKKYPDVTITSAVETPNLFVFNAPPKTRPDSLGCLKMVNKSSKRVGAYPSAFMFVEQLNKSTIETYNPSEIIENSK